MVPVEVMCSLSKVGIQGDQLLCLGVMTVSIETCPKAVGSEAYVHLVTFAAHDTVNEDVSLHVNVSWSVYGVSDTGKKDMSSFGLRTNLTAFSTPYHSRLYSSNGYGVLNAVRFVMSFFPVSETPYTLHETRIILDSILVMGMVRACADSRVVAIL